jgi:hypothetical protein
MNTGLTLRSSETEKLKLKDTKVKMPKMTEIK